MHPAGAHGTEVLCGPVRSSQRGRDRLREAVRRPSPRSQRRASGQPEETTEQLGQPDGEEKEARHRHENARHDPLDPDADVTERARTRTDRRRTAGASGSSAPRSAPAGGPSPPPVPAPTTTATGRRRRGSAPRRSRPGSALASPDGRGRRTGRRRCGRRGDRAWEPASAVGSGGRRWASAGPVSEAGDRKRRQRRGSATGVGTASGRACGGGVAVGCRARGRRRRRRRLRGRRRLRRGLGLDRDRDGHARGARRSSHRTVDR